MYFKILLLKWYNVVKLDNNLFKLNGAKEQCDELSKNKIKVSWGRDIIVVNKCNFKGGGCYKDIPVPVPAQESLEFEKDNLWLYDSIIVMFDGDKDNNNKVNNYFLKKQESLGNLILLVSQPCFESTLIDYCLCGKCRTDVNSMDETAFIGGKYVSQFEKEFATYQEAKNAFGTVVWNDEIDISPETLYIESRKIEK